MRSYELRDGYTTEPLANTNMDGACKEARGLAHWGDYVDADVRRTTWVHAVVYELDHNGNETDSAPITVALDPEEPDCLYSEEHDWRSPYWLVGGLEENPGCVGHGGGVVCTEVCMRCGCARIRDSWAQDPATGEQGLDSVEYQPEHCKTEVEDWATERLTETAEAAADAAIAEGLLESIESLDDIEPTATDIEAGEESLGRELTSAETDEFHDAYYSHVAEALDYQVFCDRGDGWVLDGDWGSDLARGPEAGVRSCCEILAREYPDVTWGYALAAEGGVPLEYMVTVVYEAPEEEE